ncbi:MAG: hypothetical protein AAFV51_00230 [Pseudomonadota bacterium]
MSLTGLAFVELVLLPAVLIGWGVYDWISTDRAMKRGETGNPVNGGVSGERRDSN